MSVFAFNLFKLLHTFSPKELKSFGKWLQSPWCNSNKSLIVLFEKIKKHYPNYDHPSLTKERLFKHVFPNGKYSDQGVHNLLSKGYLAAERFLIFQKLDQDQNLQKDLLTEEQQKRHLEDWFFRDAKKEINRLEDKTVKSWEDHLSLLRLHRRVYHHPNQRASMQTGGRIIIAMGKQIDLVYLLEKATIINEKIFRNRILKNENHEIESELKKWRVASEGIKHISIDLYRKRFEYSKANMVEKYFELRKAFIEQQEQLNEQERKVHLSSLLNDTALLVRSKSLHIKDGLPLYQLGLQTGILLHQGILNSNLYCTIVAASNSKKDFEFTTWFIETYTKQLKREYQLDGEHWARAHTYYWESQLDLSLDILLQHKITSQYFQLICRILITQVYFDLFLKDASYRTFLFNYFDSFEKWILRDKLRSEFIKKGYLRFIQVCRALARYHSDVNFNLDKIKELMHNESNIQAQNWLFERVDAVINQK